MKAQIQRTVEFIYEKSFNRWLIFSSPLHHHLLSCLSTLWWPCQEITTSTSTTPKSSLLSSLTSSGPKSSHSRNTHTHINSVFTVKFLTWRLSLTVLASIRGVINVILSPLMLPPLCKHNAAPALRSNPNTQTLSGSIIVDNAADLNFFPPHLCKNIPTMTASLCESLQLLAGGFSVTCGSLRATEAPSPSRWRLLDCENSRDDDGNWNSYWSWNPGYEEPRSRQQSSEFC